MLDQSKPILYLLISLASLFIIISGIQDSASIINPILLAVVITITVLPLPAWFTARGVPGWLSLVLTMLLVLGVIGLVLVLISLGLVQLTEKLPLILNDLTTEETTEFLSSGQMIFGIQVADLAEAISDLASNQRITQFGISALFSLLNVVAQGFLVFLIFIFMLSAGLAMPSSYRLGLHPGHPVVERFVAFTHDTRYYMTLTTIINLMVAIGNTLLLLVLDVELALLWGLLSWFMGYIPAIGFWIAMIPPLVLAFVGGGLVPAAIVFIGYVLINGTVENLIKPRYMGQRLSISPVVIVISLFVWGWLLGAVGAILSIPLTLLVLGILDMFDSTKWMSLLMRVPGKEGEDRQEAIVHLKGTWDNVVKAVRGKSSSGKS